MRFQYTTTVMLLVYHYINASSTAPAIIISLINTYNMNELLNVKITCQFIKDSTGNFSLTYLICYDTNTLNLWTSTAYSFENITQVAIVRNHYFWYSKMILQNASREYMIKKDLFIMHMEFGYTGNDLIHDEF